MPLGAGGESRNLGKRLKPISVHALYSMSLVWRVPKAGNRISKLLAKIHGSLVGDPFGILQRIFDVDVSVEGDGA